MGAPMIIDERTTDGQTTLTMWLDDARFLDGGSEHGRIPDEAWVGTFASIRPPDEARERGQAPSTSAPDRWRRSR